MAKNKNINQADLPSTIEECHKVIMDLQSVVEDLNKTNAQQSLELQSVRDASEKKGVLSTFKHEGETFMFIVPSFHHNFGGKLQKFTHAEAVKNKELIADLVKKGIAVIEKIDTKAESKNKSESGAGE